MKGAFLLSPFLLALVSALALAEEPLELEDENARINYSVGYQVGGDFKRQGREIDLDILVRGVADAIVGVEPLMTPREMRKELTELQKKVMAARKARAEEAAAGQREAGKAFLEANKAKDGVQVTESGLQYKIIESGTGKQPRPTDTVTVNYRGTRIDGTEFDSSYKRGKPAQFRLDRVIKGWTEGLQLVKEGGKAQLVVPSDLAYGQRGRLANQVLIFDVELIAVGGPETEAQAQGEQEGSASE